MKVVLLLSSGYCCQAAWISGNGTPGKGACFSSSSAVLLTLITMSSDLCIFVGIFVIPGIKRFTGCSTRWIHYVPMISRCKGDHRAFHTCVLILSNFCAVHKKQKVIFHFMPPCTVSVPLQSQGMTHAQDFFCYALMELQLMFLTAGISGV